MARPKISETVGSEAVTVSLAAGRDLASGSGVPQDILATAVRYLLQCLAEYAPGHSVEVRVPPFAAVQCIEGPDHTRGTPPNTVEMDAVTWIGLATGSISWPSGLESGRIHASGQRADLSEHVPLAKWTNSVRSAGE